MKKIFLIGISIWLGCSIMSCSEEEVSPSTPEIEFNFIDPSYNRIFNYGDTIWMRGTVSWELEMHGYEITLQNSTTNVNVFMDHKHIDDTKYEIKEYWINTLSKPAKMVFTFSAIKNHITEETSIFQRTINCAGM